MSDARVPSRVDGIFDGPVDGEYVVMHPETKAFFALTETGSAIWELVDGQRTVDDIVDSLATRYSASRDVIAADVADYVGRLSEMGFVSLD